MEGITISSRIVIGDDPVMFPYLAALEGMSPDKIDRMFLVARLYYEGRVLSGRECQICKHRVSYTNPLPQMCPRCKNDGMRDLLTRCTQQDVADELNRRVSNEELAASNYDDRSGRPKLFTRSDIQRILETAEQYGVYRVLVTRNIDGARLGDLQYDMQKKLGLKKVILVPGREEMMTTGLSRGTREAIRLAALRAAANEIDDYLQRNEANLLRLPEEIPQNSNRPVIRNGQKNDNHLASVRSPDTLCLAWGASIHSIVQLLHPSRSLPNLEIVPMLGVLSKQQTYDTFEANASVQAASQVYRTPHSYLLPAPAIVRDGALRKMISDEPIVRDILDKIKNATLVVTSLTEADGEESQLVHNNLITQEDADEMREAGAIGEISGLWIDNAGNPVSSGKIEPIGMTIEDLRHCVLNNKNVLVISAADRTRIRPLYAAIKGRICNTVVCDHVTAEQCLRLYEMSQ